MVDADGAPDRAAPEPRDEREWERGWDGHERAQRERMARLPLWEKIAWLEEAQRVARALGAIDRRASGDAPGSSPPK